MGVVTIGVDIGQKVDFTAISVVEAERRQSPIARLPETHHLARHLERLPLGVPYPEIAKRLVALISGVMRLSEANATIYLDATGVGQPVVDVLRATGVRGRLVPVYFTHGDRRTQENGEVRLGKAWLVSRMQTLLQSGRLHLPKTAEATTLAQELLDYEIRVTEDANDRYGAFRVGTHDDLVTALGLAVQEDGRCPFTAAVGPANEGLRRPSMWGGETRLPPPDPRWR